MSCGFFIPVYFAIGLKLDLVRVSHKGLPLLSEFKASSPQPVEPKTTLTEA